MASRESLTYLLVGLIIGALIFYGVNTITGAAISELGELDDESIINSDPTKIDETSRSCENGACSENIKEIDCT